MSRGTAAAHRAQQCAAVGISFFQRRKSRRRKKENGSPEPAIRLLCPVHSAG